MSIVREAAHLYIYSKKLNTLEKQLPSLSKKAEKHKAKLEKTTSESRKEKHQRKHTKTTEKIAVLMKEHATILKKLQQHHDHFVKYLHKEHKTR